LRYCAVRIAASQQFEISNNLAVSSALAIPIMTVFSRPTDKHYEALHGITKKNSRTERPVAVFISVLVPSALLVYAICSCFRWSKVEENKNTAKASSLDFSSKSFATKMAWIPLMESGIVAGRYKDFPDWYQCWAPFCENCEVPLPAPGSLQGLRIFVLSSGGEKVCRQEVFSSEVNTPSSPFAGLNEYTFFFWLTSHTRDT